MHSCVALALGLAPCPSHKLGCSLSFSLCSLCSLVPTRQMVGFTPVSSPASMRHPVSEDQMNHFHCTDALLTDRLSWSGSSDRLALKLTARSGETAPSSAQDSRGRNQALHFRVSCDSSAVVEECQAWPHFGFEE